MVMPPLLTSGAEATTGTKTKGMMGPQMKIKGCDQKSGGEMGRMIVHSKQTWPREAEQHCHQCTSYGKAVVQIQVLPLMSLHSWQVPSPM